MPSAQLRVGTTWTGTSVIEATWRAASTTLGLLGRISSSSAVVARTASSSSPVDGLADWPPFTTRNAPYSRNGAAMSVSTAARPSEGATATTPSGRRVTGDGTSSAPAGCRSPRPSRPATAVDAVPGPAELAPPASPTAAAAFASRTSWAWLSRFSIVIRDSIPTDRPYAITASGRSLWTWTLARWPSPATSTESPIDSR